MQFDQLKRREFITLLGGAVAAWPFAGRAQQAATQHRIAIFHPAIPTTLLTETGGGSAWRAFFSELRRLGYIEGENLLIERYSAEGHHERYADLAREIVTRNPDLIVTGTNPVVIVFKAATSTIPLVAFMLDPLKAGLVTSLARPGGNLTGITLDAGIEIWGKRLEMLKEAIPSTAKAAFLGMRDGWEGSSGQVLRDAAGQLGISLVFMLPQKGTPSEIERVFAAMEQQRPDAEHSLQGTEPEHSGSSSQRPARLLPSWPFWLGSPSGRPQPIAGVETAVLTPTKFYERRAKDCVQAAGRTDNPKHREQLLKLAYEWAQAAALRTSLAIDAAEDGRPRSFT